MRSPHVLIIDDEENLVSSLVYGLQGHGIEATGAYDAAGGLQALVDTEPDVVLVDLRLPDRCGIDVLADIRARAPDLPVIMISAYGETRIAVDAVKRGAEDFLTKPFDLDEVVHLIHKVTERGRLAREVAYRRHRAVLDDGILGEAPSMQALRERIETVARSNTRTVLLLGESGTGKALVARAIHNRSAVADGPFVEINCAALPDNLIEAELFGAEKGAYTGAESQRPGLAQLADGGTLLLDEIGELPPHVQAKLLHFIENRSFRPVGTGRERSADVRIVAATNRDIEGDVQAGAFRADLYYRLNVVPLVLPKLADRPEDVPHLARHFAAETARNESCPAITFGPAAADLMSRYAWPGNVRELKNLVERLTILYPGAEIGPEHLPPELHARSGGDDASAAIEDRLAATEQDILLQALADAGGHKGRAASALGISRHALKRRLQRLGLQSSGLRPNDRSD